MNTQTQVIIDSYIAKPIAYLLNFVVRLLGKLLAINHTLDKEFNTIVVAKFKGIGSIIQSTPMLNALRKKHPKAQIIFVSTASNRKILEQITLIDTIVTLDDRTLWRFLVSNVKALYTLIKKRPDVYIDLEIYSDYSTLFTLFSLSTNRIGFYLRSSSFRMGIYTHMMFFNARVPVSKAYLQLAGLLGCATNEDDLFTLQTQNTQDINAPYIVVNPNASDLRIERRWSSANFVTLIQLILDNYPNLTIVLIGSKDEYNYTQTIAQQFTTTRVVNTAGKTTINELITSVANAHIMISNDTGPMHIAFSTNTPIICLFGPCAPEQYGLSKNAHVIYKRVYCSPCVHDFIAPPCKGNNVCMQLISVTEVYNKFKELMQIPTMSNNSIETEFIYNNTNNIVLGKVIR